MPWRKIPVMPREWGLEIPPGLQWGQMFNRARQSKRTKQVARVRAAETPRTLLAHLGSKVSPAQKAARCLKIGPPNLRNKHFVLATAPGYCSVLSLAMQSSYGRRGMIGGLH